MTQKRHFRVDDLFRWKAAAELTVGPGPRVGFTLREADLEESAYRSQVWTVSPGSEPVQLTRGDKGCTGARWSSDGRFLAFLSSRPDGKPGENGSKPQVWLLPTAGGEAFCVTKAPEGVRSFRWAPDGQWLAFVADEPHQDAVKARKAKEKKQKNDAVVEHAERRRRQIWRADPKAGAEAKLLFAGDYGLSEIEVAPDGLSVAYTSNETGRADDYLRFSLYLCETATGQSRRLTRETGGCWSIPWRPDGQALSFLAPHDPRYSYSRQELFTVPAAGGETTNLTHLQPEFTGDVAEALWESPQQLIITAMVGCYSYIYRMDGATGALTLLSALEEGASGISLSPDRRHLAYLAESRQSVPEVMLLDLAEQEPPKALTDLNPFLKSEITWGSQEVIRWQGEGGMMIEGVLALPPDRKEGERLPLLVYIHGGPHSRTPNLLRQYFSFQALAAQGYAVLAPNYRGGAGYGHAHAVCNRCDLGGADYRDIMAGVDHVIGAGVADEARMGILGGSYGGYMTNWAIGQTDRFKAAVSLFGIFSLVTDYSQSEMPGWELGYLGGYWWEQEEAYRRSSPSTFVTRMTTPVLIMHGDADNNTNPANSREMHQALRHLGRTVQYVRYPREGHGIAEPTHKQDEYRRVLAWFEQHVLGGKPLAEGGAEADGHRLAVTAVEGVAAYSGRKPKGRFVEISLRLFPGAAGSLKLDLSAVRLLNTRDDFTWEVGVAGVAAGLLLVPAGAAVEACLPAALTLVFDLPAGAPAGEWRLEAVPFPPVRITL